MDRLDPDQLQAEAIRRLSQQSGGHVWSSLDAVRGKVAQLYVLGLTCPVRKLEIKNYRSNRHHMALEVLRHAHPRKLTISLDPRATEGATSLNELSLLANPSSNRSHVTHLTVKMTVGYHGTSTQRLLVRRFCVFATVPALTSSAERLPPTSGTIQN